MPELGQPKRVTKTAQAVELTGHPHACLHKSGMSCPSLLEGSEGLAVCRPRTCRCCRDAVACHLRAHEDSAEGAKKEQKLAARGCYLRSHHPLPCAALPDTLEGLITALAAIVMQFLPWVLQGSLQSKAQSAMVVAMMDTCNVWFLCAATSRLENGPPPVHQAGKTSTNRRVEVLAAWCRALSTLPSLKSWATQLRLR